MPGDPRDTPAMQQYFRFKRAHPGCVLLFRMGDFYETFDEDAVTIAKTLGLTLTQRTEGLPMAGVPYHQLEVYLARLINQGFRVAVAEQMQDPKDAKGLIERAVTRVVTAGTRVDDSLLADDAACTLAAVAFVGEGDDSPAGVACVELSTGSFVVATCAASTLADELVRRGVSELLYSPLANETPPPRVQRVLQALNVAGTPRPPWQFRADEATRKLMAHFGVSTLAGFGLAEDDPALPAAGAALAYLQQTQAMEDEQASGGKVMSASKGRRPTLAHLRPPKRESAGDHCVVDAMSLRALEVERTLRAGARGDVVSGAGRGGDPSLLALILGTPGAFVTPMGKRLLRDWLCRPLGQVEPIRARQACVRVLVEDRRLADELRAALAEVQDVARIIGRVALARATPRDLVALGKSLAKVGAVMNLVESCAALVPHGVRLRAVEPELAELTGQITRACVDSPPAHLREGGLIRPGIDAELDEARTLQTDADRWLVSYQEKFAEKYDLPGIKVGYNRVFGYYIELSAAQSKTLAGRGVPPPLIRKQTLKNAERYTTTELAELEAKITTAQARALERERELFDALCVRAAARTDRALQFAQVVAELDCLAGLAERAHRKGWTCPEIVEEPVLVIHSGRHPVLEELLGSNFVPNDVELGSLPSLPGRGQGEGLSLHPSQREGPLYPSRREGPGEGSSSSSSSSHAPLALITGPNMAGKSTFIRQCALITLLAHAGSFVPADRATIGVVDRIFTRIGADDALHAGQSTFMVEMTETANILNHATGRSLVILDEVGRGTSTLDGLSLAWAMTEYLARGRDEVGGEGRREDAAFGARHSAWVKTPNAQSRAPNADSSTTPSLRLSVSPSLAPRTLFATHYHELTELEDLLPGRVKNLHVEVREWPGADGHGEIIFLHRILPGRTDQSYGVHVAKLAGVPRAVIERAREVLDSLAVQHDLGGGEAGGLAKSPAGLRDAAKRIAPPATANGHRGGQLSLFTEYVNHPVVSELRELKLDQLTPMRAFDELRRLQEMLGAGNGGGDSTQRHRGAEKIQNEKKS